WADEQAAFATAAIPPRLDTGDTSRVFFDLPAMQPQVDFLEYTSETVADAISSIAAHVKTIMQDQGMVIVPYGYTFELARNDAGHFALGSLLDGTVDAFASPVSRFDRALGGAGSPMGPVDSVRLHGKQWFVMDDTRTGLSRDAATGAIGRLEGLRIEDVYSVQRRNFATVLSHELGLIWTDPEGTGALCDAEMWNRFAAMEKAYEGYQARGAAKSMDPAESWPPPGRMLAVVVDEASRSYQQCDEKLNALILMQAQDAALRSAMPVRFYLLQDLLDDRVPPAAVYLFPNLFYLDENTRLQLHALLRRQQAAAIWLYAPGYIADKPDVANICATTRMTVKAFKEPASSGSKYKLAGAWIDKNEEIGPGITWNPLFYIDDENADVITEYRESGKPSAAITFLDDEWSSIFLAEPFLTPGLLREILRILEQSLCIQEDGGKFFDVTYFNANLFGIHAKESGERMINLGTERAWDVQDLLSPEIGWLQTSGFMLPLRAGETRLLQLTPAAVTAPPAVPAEPAPADAVDDPSGGG
ncbi:MAG: hypothetical protein QG656_2025, partial [Candidatus Hydrogenedentes bacterium]|nr:hypothetical protein [Candidatus Hydrogenedentota bacterium]